MSVIRVGSTGKYADGWEQIFGGMGHGRGGKPAAKKGKGKAKPAARQKAAASKPGKKKAKSRGR